MKRDPGGRDDAAPAERAAALPDGIVLVDKPAGITSFDVIRRLRRAAAGRKIGHTGTLDPFATGLLPVCVGEATKLASFVVAGEKEYEARIRLGSRTDTGDPDGEIVERAPVPTLPAGADLDRALAGLVGIHRQVPPMHSAVKVSGERLYERARRGETIERPAREVVVRTLEVVEVRPPEISVRVECSKGTYVRVLAEEIARVLGTVGHLVELRRTRVGDLGIGEAAPVEAILAAPPAGSGPPPSWLVPLDGCLPRAPSIDLDPAAARRVCHGQIGPEIERDWPPAAREGEIVRLVCRGRLLAVALRETPVGPARLLCVLAPPGAFA